VRRQPAVAAAAACAAARQSCVGAGQGERQGRRGVGVHVRNEKTAPLLSSHRAPDGSGRTGGLPGAADHGTAGELRGASG
jgi:hypothetical protein